MNSLDQQNAFSEWFQNFRPLATCCRIAMGEKIHQDARVSSFVAKRMELQKEGKPIGVEIGYHYTKGKNVDGISKRGLQADKCTRAFFGPGIYVATNPFAFSSFGDVGYLCLILTGVQKGMYAFDGGECDDEEWPDSFRGNKLAASLAMEDRTTYFDEIVLTSSDQVLPLIRFPIELIDNARLMQQMHTTIHQWVTSSFPGGFSLSPIFAAPNHYDLAYADQINAARSSLNKNAQLVSVGQQIQAQALSIAASASFVQPATFGQPFALHTSQAPTIAPSASFVQPAAFGQTFALHALKCCTVCHQPVQPCEPALEMPACQHSFHHRCLHPDILQCAEECPLCCGIVCVSSGPTLTGALYAKPSTKTYFPGYPSRPVLELMYHATNGCDLQGKPDASKLARTVYLPDIPESRELLQRLLFSFRYGSSFTLSTGNPDTIEGTIPHITQSLRQGKEVWVHPRYFPEVHGALTKLGVPEALSLPPLQNGRA